ncbi:hypothetical protein HPB48_004694 [Haemaphysalis longicornis]|uniref:BZIP domain-containing protein n=1 Tax=Haemaphysalis longicornis TaxID=44386 RepID=A0A9J6G0Y7_HAELO|nr:hypothetical protein HPB48_004694 [Haemaphysalis longicornis]
MSPDLLEQRSVFEARSSSHAPPSAELGAADAVSRCPGKAADLYPAADDCWGGGHEQREPSVEKPCAPLAAGGPPPHNYTEPFPGVLLNNATLGPPPMDHSNAYLQGAFGATACSGLPCNNVSSLAEGPTYGQDFPDYLYSPGMAGYGGMGGNMSAGGMGCALSGMASMGNATASPAMGCTPSDYLLNDLLADEDLHLMDMVASPTDMVSAPYPVQLSVAEDRMDNSSDTGVSSMGSERVPSLSEDNEWLDSCSESSSSHADVDSDAKRLLEVAQKKYKLFGRRPGLSVLCVCAENCEESSSSEEEEEEEGGQQRLQRQHHLGYETEEQRQARASRDEKRARALNLPLSNAEIVDLPIDEFNERLAKYELTEAQLALIRDIRRRGKNKVAAQNCRKRKLDQIMSLQQDVETLHLERQELERRHEELLAQRLMGRDKYSRLCQLLAARTTRPISPTLEHHLGSSLDGGATGGVRKKNAKWESGE